MKKYVVIIIVSVIAFVLINVGAVLLVLYGIHLANEPYVVSKTVETTYGDEFYIEYREGSVGLQPKKVSFKVLYNNEEIPNICQQWLYYSMDAPERMHIVVRMCAEGRIRAYEFNWGVLYTSDDGNSFKGMLTREYEYMKRYETDEEFAQIYGMLCDGKPFYDERFAEHMDINKLDLPDSTTAEQVEIGMTINEVEALVGKAQRCVPTEMSSNGERVRGVVFEHDLSDGRILVVCYNNKSNKDEMKFYVTTSNIRNLYEPEELEAAESASLPQTSIPADWTTAPAA